MLDNLVLFLLLFCILYILFRPWLPFSIRAWFFPDKPEEAEPLQGLVPDILREHGYEPVQEKIKTQVHLAVDEEEYESRLYFDYIAKREDQYYLVIIARDRKPVKWSGVGLRDFFLASFLVVQPLAILYVIPELRVIKVVEIDLENRPKWEEKKASFPFKATFSFIAGMMVMWWIMK
ncbi:hypothetical protein [Risungbinella massiliensis]|uniref:hypothetical protein n=1 Tax=Risungbinella massiliensis TaxID=1329796 RepID=UPI0005CBE3D8|nr:hypothetical protein [Risungbinella massiliensis]